MEATVDISSVDGEGVIEGSNVQRMKCLAKCSIDGNEGSEHQMEVDDRDVDDEEESSVVGTTDAEKLHDLVSLIVCGKLRGELPTGFLEHFNHLPNEILLKIWGYLKVKERFRLRLVCTKWKSLWESLKEARKKVAEMHVAVSDGKISFKVKGNQFCGSEIVVANQPTSVSQVLTLVQLGLDFGWELARSDPRVGILVLEGGAANREMVQMIMKQTEWRFSKLVFKGETSGLTEQLLCDLMKFIATRSTTISVNFLEVLMDEGVVTDRVVESCGSALREFVFFAAPNCTASPLKLTDASLPFLIKEKCIVVLPPCPGITLNGIRNALQTIEVTPGFVDHFSQRFTIGVTEEVRASAILHLEVNSEKYNVVASELPELRVLGVDELPPDPSEPLGSVCFTFTAKEKNDGIEGREGHRAVRGTFGHALLVGTENENCRNEIIIETLSPEDMERTAGSYRVNPMQVEEHHHRSYRSSETTYEGLYSANQSDLIYALDDDDYSNDYDVDEEYDDMW